MHCELVVPGLLSIAQPPRAPSLELLLRRGRASRGERQPLEAWLQAQFELPALAAGALSILGEGGEPGTAAWARADPIHLRLLRDRVGIVPAEAIGISAGEAEALAASLRAHFGERLALRIHSPERWSIRLEAPLPLPSVSSLEVAGRPAAPGGPADALLTEIQMVLHEHPVNEAREARGVPAINSVWLWGGGAQAALQANSRWQSVTSGDALLHGLARAAEMRARPPSSGLDWLERAPEEGRHLVVLDALRAPAALSDTTAFSEALEALERDWFSPIVAALRENRAGMVTIHVPDAARALSVEAVRGDLRRFWRRPRPLADWTDE
jgi:hypothetical protein